MNRMTLVAAGVARALAGVLVVGILALAGCGGDSDDSDAEQAAPTIESTSEEQALPRTITADGARSVDLSDRLIRRTRIARGPDWMVAGFGSVWVKEDFGRVIRVDVETGEVVSRIAAGRWADPTCQGIGKSDDAIWSCPRVGSIVRIDPETNAVASTLRVEKVADQGQLVSAAGRLWLLTGRGDRLTGFDLQEERPSATVSLGSACTELTGSDATLWAMCPANDRVLRIDPEAGEITGELQLPRPRTASLADELWVAFKDGVAQVDPETLDVLAVYDAQATGGSVFATEDAVWVREPGRHFLVRIDPSKRRIVETIEAEDLPSGGNVIVAGGSVWATAVDDETLVQLRPAGR